MSLKQMTDVYAAQKKEMLIVAKAELLKTFNEMFDANPAITGVMWTQCIGGEGWDRQATVSEMEVTTDEDPIKSEYGGKYGEEMVNLYPETKEDWKEGIDYDYMNNVFFASNASYKEMDNLFEDMFPYENGLKIIITRAGIHTEHYIHTV